MLLARSRLLQILSKAVSDLLIGATYSLKLLLCSSAISVCGIERSVAKLQAKSIDW